MVGSTSDEASVNTAINVKFKDAQLDTTEWEKRFSSESREVFAARQEIAQRLGLRPGERIADVGAGTGIFVPLFAEAVGQDGKVVAVDIAPAFLELISTESAKLGLAQVETLLGADQATNLAPGSVDVVFHCDTYHHFEFPRSMNQDLFQALAPGGRLYVVDFERIPGVSREWLLGHVRCGKEQVIEEIEAAGFELVEELEVSELKENYLLQFRKPGPSR